MRANKFMLWLRLRYPNLPLWIYMFSYFCSFCIYAVMVWIAVTAEMWLAVHFVRLCSERPHQYFHMSGYLIAFVAIAATQGGIGYFAVKRFFR